MIKNINSKELAEMLKNDGNSVELIDVREKDEYDLIRVKGSKLIPLSEVGEKISQIDWNKKVVFICRSGSRSAYIVQMLSQAGYDPINLEGGIYALNLDNCDCIEKDASCCEGYL